MLLDTQIQQDESNGIHHQKRRVFNDIAEGMKTYNAIRADFDGTVTAICATPGDTISEDDVLMKIG